jgi:citrate lyase subunit beta/citryl-CoA lyase
MTVRLRRSELAVPASKPAMIEKAAASDADLVFLDLEDAVVPALKVSSRQNVVEGLKSMDWGRTLRAVRVNSADTEWATDDVQTVVEQAGEHLDILIVPKVKASRDVWFFETLLDQLEKKLRLKKKIGLEILIEEAEALSRVEEIAGCSPRLEALILGFGDLAASLGIRMGHEQDSAHRYPGDLWHGARTRLIAAARAHGLDAIDGPFPNFRDPDGYRREATWASTLGAVGKWCIHPGQIEIANDTFAPTPQEIELAQRMCEAYEASEKGGQGAAGSSGFLVDAASVRIFEAVLERAKLTGRI